MMPRMRFCVFFFLVVLGLLSSTSAQSNQKSFTNADVVDMVHAGLAESTIILSIKSSKTDFDTSPRALIELKKNGVSQNIMDTMLGAPSTPVASTSSAPAAVPAGNPEGRALMAKVVNALGGEKAIAAVKVTRTATVREVKNANASMSMEIVLTIAFPDRLHLAVKAPQVNSITVCQPNGAVLLVNNIPQPVTERTRHDLVDTVRLNIINVAQHTNDPTYTFSIAGEEKVGDVETSILEISADGNKTRWSVDPVSGRIMRVSRMLNGVDGKPALTRFEYEDWRTISGVLVPFKVFQNGASTGEIKSFEINPEIRADLFDKPGDVAAKPSTPSSAVSTAAGPASAWKGTFFRDVRKKYENASVVVLGDMASIKILGRTDNWHTAKQKDGRYVAGKYLDVKYITQAAKVIAVQLEKSPFSTEHKLGPSDDDTLDPYFSLVVRFEDGTTAITTTESYTAKNSVTLAGDVAHHEDVMRAGAIAMMARPVYAVASSHFYYPDLKVSDAIEVVTSGYLSKSVSQVYDVPRLQPLIVSKAGVLKAANALLLTLTLPDGRNVLSVVQCDNPDESCYSNHGSDLLPEIPSFLTKEEIKAIQDGGYFNGMSQVALYMSIGFPDRTNDYGKGGYQLVYHNGKTLIYTDAAGKITDSQSFD